MKFLVDAQLPRRLARWLQVEGHEALHTRDLPRGNRTGDTAINEISVREQRAVITKDEDFVVMFLLRHQPYKLLLVSTGNISNKELEQLFRNNLEAILEAFETHDFVELDRCTMTCHWLKTAKLALEALTSLGTDSVNAKRHQKTGIHSSRDRRLQSRN